jgi:hypothetical protein
MVAAKFLKHSIFNKQHAIFSTSSVPSSFQLCVMFVPENDLRLRSRNHQNAAILVLVLNIEEKDMSLH